MQVLEYPEFREKLAIMCPLVKGEPWTLRCIRTYRDGSTHSWEVSIDKPMQELREMIKESEL